jgi:hypothetical protein
VKSERRSTALDAVFTDAKFTDAETFDKLRQADRDSARE